MKKLITLAVLVLSTVSVSAKTFEGYIHYIMKTGRDSMNMTYAIKGNKLRMEMSVQGGYRSIGLFNPAESAVKILMPQQKMYMEFTVDPNAVAKVTKSKNFEFVETGRTETIAGYECSEFQIKDRKEIIELWATDELGKYVSFADMQKSKGKTPAWAKELLDRGLFPLRMVMKNKRGKEKMRMEAEKVEKADLDDILFIVPEDYNKFGLPGLGGLLKGLGR